MCLATDRGRRRCERIEIDAERVFVDHARFGGPGVEDEAEELFWCGRDQLLRKRGRQSKQEPRPVPERRAAGHAFELVDGWDHVEDSEPLDAFRVVERHAVGDAGAAVVADDGKAAEPKGFHQRHKV